jgi:hypothetical protein
MTPATLVRPNFSMDFGRRPRTVVDPRDDHACRAPDDGGRFTLDDMLVGAWEDLRSGRSAACPVCGGALAPRFAAGPRPVAGRCGDCGSQLS